MSEDSHIVKLKLSEYFHIRVEVGSRLRDERRRLGLNQADFGELAKVSRRTQASYEAGSGSPDSAYLAALAIQGVDVLYVVTGRREAIGQGVSEAATAAFVPAASPVQSQAEEHELLESFRRLRAEHRQALRALARSLAGSDPA